MIRALFISVSVMLVPPSALADRNDVQQLYEACKDERDATELGYCFGFLAGIVNGLGRKQDGVEPGILCQFDFTLGAVRQQFLNWARENPQHWTKDEEFGAVSALVELWGCPDAKIDSPD